MTIKKGWLHVYNDDREVRVPINDLYSVVIDNRRAMLSVAVLTTLAEAGVHILFCNEEHLPSAELLPPCGSVRAMIITEKQYLQMRLLVGEKLKDEAFLDSKDLLEI